MRYLPFDPILRLLPATRYLEVRMSPVIRDVQRGDLDAVLALNNAASPGILPLDAADMERFFATADYFRVAESGQRIVGFLIALREGHDYASTNYRWFSEHETSFVYIDRIVLAPDQRGFGLGRVFYCDVESFAEVRVPRLTCEVFLEPPNDAAVLFHGTFGFNEVGQQRVQPGDIRVSLLAKDMPSFGYVRERYLARGGLPDLPWLHGRRLPAAPDVADAAGAGS
mgnify:CR=1 FL=1